MPVIQASHLSKKYHGVLVVNNVSFTVDQGKTVCLIGKSGSGKTTTLKMLNRSIKPTNGQIEVFGENIVSYQPEKLRRKIGYVIQDGGLFPHWTVERNVALVPYLEKWKKNKVLKRVKEMLELVNLEPGNFLNKYPAELSGGQRQRIGIARALAADPPLMLMDEPFSALDPITRSQLQKAFLDLKKTLNKTVVFVTHDLNEAFLLADEIIILEKGEVQQIDTPQVIRNNPANDFVRQFIESFEIQA